MTDAISPQAQSDLIGSIYDCALDPSRWDQTLAHLSEAARSMANIENTANTALRPYSKSEIGFLADRMYSRSISGLRCDTPAARRDYLAASRFLRRLANMYEAASKRTLHTVILQEDEVSELPKASRASHNSG